VRQEGFLSKPKARISSSSARRYTRLDVTRAPASASPRRTPRERTGLQCSDQGDPRDGHLQEIQRQYFPSPCDGLRRDSRSPCSPARRYSPILTSRARLGQAPRPAPELPRPRGIGDQPRLGFAGRLPRGRRAKLSRWRFLRLLGKQLHEVIRGVPESSSSCCSSSAAGVTLFASGRTLTSRSTASGRPFRAHHSFRRLFATKIFRGAIIAIRAGRSRRRRASACTGRRLPPRHAATDLALSLPGFAHRWLVLIRNGRHSVSGSRS